MSDAVVASVTVAMTKESDLAWLTMTGGGAVQAKGSVAFGTEIRK